MAKSKGPKNGDKRTVATDALETLGTAPLDETAARDAIHLAVEPVIAGEALDPGEPILLRDGKAFACLVENALGIVDPFLRSTVRPEQRFWLVVMPRQITSLRHVWEHPAFPPSEMGIDAKAEATAHILRTFESQKWLKEFCSRSDCPDYHTLMAAAIDHAQNGGGEYLHFDEDAHGDIPPEFWDHLEAVTGVRAENPAAYFSCSC